MKNGFGEECYALHLPQHRGNEQYAFEENYKMLATEAKEYIGNRKHLSYMDKSVGKRFIDWIATIEQLEERCVDEFRETLSEEELINFNMTVSNRYDPVHCIWFYHFNSHMFIEHGRQMIIKQGAVPWYLFEVVNQIPRPIWY